MKGSTQYYCIRTLNEVRPIEAMQVFLLISVVLETKSFTAATEDILGTENVLKGGTCGLRDVLKRDSRTVSVL